MDAKKLKTGMTVRYSDGNIVEVTHVPPLDRYGECFFSGILRETKNDFYIKYLNVEVEKTWNSAFCFPL